MAMPLLEPAPLPTLDREPITTACCEVLPIVLLSPIAVEKLDPVPMTLELPTPVPSAASMLLEMPTATLPAKSASLPWPQAIAVSMALEPPVVSAAEAKPKPSVSIKHAPSVTLAAYAVVGAARMKPAPTAAPAARPAERCPLSLHCEHCLVTSTNRNSPENRRRTPQRPGLTDSVVENSIPVVMFRGAKAPLWRSDSQTPCYFCNRFYHLPPRRSGERRTGGLPHPLGRQAGQACKRRAASAMRSGVPA